MAVMQEKPLHSIYQTCTTVINTKYLQFEKQIDSKGSLKTTLTLKKRKEAEIVLLEVSSSYKEYR
jgi:hypothetical protein